MQIVMLANVRSYIDAARIALRRAGCSRKCAKWIVRYCLDNRTITELQMGERILRLDPIGPLYQKRTKG